MAALTARAPAKLNLYIHVLGRRADGYHEIESGIAFAKLHDVVTVAPADQLSLKVDGPFAHAAGGGDDNLVLKAARSLLSHTRTTKGAAITLTKNIPVGAGLGGGSSDAATVLNLLDELWELYLGKGALRALAPSLGADVAMCIDPKPVIAQGIGEVLMPMPCALPPCFVLLVHPRTPLLTVDVYRALHAVPLREHVPFAPNEAQPSFTQLMHHLARTRNDLQRAAIAISSQVTEVLLALETVEPRAELVRMTGSGACCFALYNNQGDAEAAANYLRAQYPGWWVEATALL